jgi:hypothetical protein
MTFIKNLKEVTLQSLPLSLLLIFVLIFIKPMDASELISLIIGYVFVILGQALFLLGIEYSILPMGELVGSNLYKLKKVLFMIMFGLIFGIISSIAEPALRVIAHQLHSINNTINVSLCIWICSFGVGAGVAISMYKTLKNISMKRLLIILYAITFGLCLFAPNQFIGISFDISGATTGDLSTPFILTLGAGVARTISAKHRSEEQFGIIGIASVTPLIAFLIFGLIKGNTDPSELAILTNSSSTLGTIIQSNLLDVFWAIIPVVITFLLYNIFFIKLTRKSIIKLLIFSGIVYVGLVIFLSGVDYGFSLAGKHIGQAFVNDDTIFFGLISVSTSWFKWFLLPLAFILCFFITLCEPSIMVLVKQVEEMTNRLISSKVLKYFLATGIGLAGFLSVLNILIDVDIRWFLLPLYFITLVLTVFTPNLFVGVAYDSGGVTGGAITSAFLVPLCLSVSSIASTDTSAEYMLVNGFGMIGYISVTPIILVLILGLIYNANVKKAQKKISSSEEEERM